MTDLELIKFLWKLLENDLTDGQTPTEDELEMLLDEFIKRGIKQEDDEIFDY